VEVEVEVDVEVVRIKYYYGIFERVVHVMACLSQSWLDSLLLR
jgi:hypothetical protein